eukprot:9524741-Alexandrium_andersonii.AAC.1
MFLRWAAETRTEHSQQVFTPGLLSQGKKKNRPPEFKGKAHNAMCVLLWVESLVLQRVEQASQHANVRAVLVRALCRQWRLLRFKGVWFSFLQARSFYRDGRRFLLAFRALNLESQVLG